MNTRNCLSQFQAAHHAEQVLRSVIHILRYHDPEPGDLLEGFERGQVLRDLHRLLDRASLKVALAALDVTFFDDEVCGIVQVLGDRESILYERPENPAELRALRATLHRWVSVWWAEGQPSPGPLASFLEIGGYNTPGRVR